MSSSKQPERFKQIADALIQREREKESRELIAQNEKKEEALIRAKETIYYHISSWAGCGVHTPQDIPIIRNGVVVGKYMNSGGFAQFLGGGYDPVESCLSNAYLVEHSQLLQSLDRYRKLRNAAQKFVQQYLALSLEEKLDTRLLQAEGAEVLGRVGKDGQILSAVGLDISAIISVHVISENLSPKINGLEAEIRRRESEERTKKAVSRAGRKRSSAAYSVAKQLAALFARINGEMPTYSENAGGVHGRYTPLLRDVFNCFGWKSLAGPAKAACRSVAEDDLCYGDYQGIASLGSILRVKE